MNRPAPEDLSAIAREAEAHDREAIAEIEASQHPDSEGGHLITPVEASRIRVRVLKSAVLDNEVAAMAARTGPRASEPPVGN